MCGKKPPAPPPIVQRDPVAEKAQADADAQMQANAETSTKRRRRSVAGGGGLASQAIRAASLGSAGAGQSLLSQAKPGG